MTDEAEQEYEKTKKKKDPDFDRETFKPRFPDETLVDLVKIQLNSAACMNKGFILDGFPRSKDGASEVFNLKIEKPCDPPAEGEDEGEPEYELKLNEKIVPQYAI